MQDNNNPPDQGIRTAFGSMLNEGLDAGLCGGFNNIVRVTYRARHCVGRGVEADADKAVRCLKCAVAEGQGSSPRLLSLRHLSFTLPRLDL